MAANDYYASHPVASNPTLLHPNAAAQPIPYSQPASQQTMPSPNLSSSPQHLSPHPSPNLSPQPSPSLTPVSSISSTDRGRGIFSSSSDTETTGRKRSKSDRAIKFIEKQVQKKIEKKLNGGSGGHGNQLGEQLDQALGQQDPTAGAGGGDYGYGTGGDYGFGTGSDYGALAGGAGGSGGALSGAFSGGGGGGGGEYGFGDASAGYGPPSDAFGSGGGGFDAGNFEWEGAGDAAEGVWGEIGASIGEALGGA